MKLLICTSEYPPYYSSGIGNVAYNVVEQLRRTGIECTVCSPNEGIKLGSSQVIEKLGIIGLLHYWYQVSKYFRVRENDFDVAWLHNPLFLKNSPFQRNLITIHTTYYGKMTQGLKPKNYNKIVSKVEKYCLNQMDREARFTAVSPQVCEELEEIGINRDTVTYIPNGVNTEIFKPSNNKKILRRGFGIPENDLMILSFGRLTEAKQPFRLIEVFSVIEEEMKDVTLVIAGKGKLLEETKKFVRRKELKKVIFLGYVDEKEVPNLYACADYYIMTSNYEGQPLTLLEAMASGLPCIVSDIPNLKIVEDARCGIGVNFNDGKKIAQEIIGYLGRDNSEHAKNARRYALKNFDWKIIARRYLEELEKVL